MAKRPPHDPVDRLRAQWAAELPGLETEPMAILGRIYRISIHAGRRIEALFADLGLERGEFDVLATLRRAGPPYRLSPTELYSSLMISSGGMTHRLDRLQRAKLIARVAAEKDRRSTLVELTPAGRALVERAVVADMELERELFRGLPAADRKQLAGLLRKLLLAVEGGEAG